MAPMEIDPRDRDWDAYRLLVITSLTALQSDMQSLRNEMYSMSGKIQSLEVKAGVWGLIAGAVPTLIAIVFLVIQRLMGTQ